VAPLSAAWTTVAVVGAGTVALKALGPVAVGGRELRPRAAGLLAVLAPALLAVEACAPSTVHSLPAVLDARAAGLAAAAVAVWLRAPLLAVIVVAAAATALVRAFL